MDVKEMIKQIGGPTVVARALGISPPSVCEWQRVPADRCEQIEAEFGIPCEDMRPDINWQYIRKSKATAA